MAEAFDRVEWSFLKRVMEKFLFPPNFINLIMSCLSTASFTLSINQQLTGSVTPTRGIRQGDPLSLTFSCYARRAWRILQAPSSLVAQLLKARYYPHSSFLDFGKGHHPSLVWNSISWGKTLLQSVLRSSVGNGTSISIYKDAWIPGYGKILYLQKPATLDHKVSSLISPNGDLDF
ncbi:uncharacterized protein LOC133032002 [Cannabis sativa]|uniref:uncharacterized protein LOC133032002 n=1 Tax=Cannabis sativa TaxID=3483 RepID=UPI0029C9C98D|nr:uncharacterized protein LOC133032002 [Cannabis sativa]